MLRDTPCCGKSVDGQASILRNFLARVHLEHLWGVFTCWTLCIIALFMRDTFCKLLVSLGDFCSRTFELMGSISACVKCETVSVQTCAHAMHAVKIGFALHPGFQTCPVPSPGFCVLLLLVHPSVEQPQGGCSFQMGARSQI